MSTPRFLIDTSAFARFHKPVVRPVLRHLSERGLLAICGPVEAEISYSARTKQDGEQVHDLLRGFDWLPCNDEVWDRVRQVQRELTERGSHRAVSVVDLAVACTAERHDATVLHYDGDFDIVAEVTGQPTRWVVPAGSAD